MGGRSGSPNPRRPKGLVLLCQARADTDLTIETFERGIADQAQVKRLPGRVEHLRRWSHDVMGVFLRLPAAERFDFLPGQYIDILLPGGRRRSFSIASPPHDSRLLELHVRRVPGGEFTEQLFGDESRAHLLNIEGPLGHFVYRTPEPPCGGDETPMLLVGGGTGLAPLKSIMRHVIENGVRREMTLFWGVRSERDLYAHAALEELARGAVQSALRARALRAIVPVGGPARLGSRGGAARGRATPPLRGLCQRAAANGRRGAQRVRPARRAARAIVFRFLRLCAGFCGAPADNGGHQVLILGGVGLQQRP